MSSVQVERVTDGYVVSRRFSNLAAAQRATDLMLGVVEEAFAPPAGGWVPSREPLNPVSQETGD